MGGTDLVLCTVLMLNLLSFMPGSCMSCDNRDISKMIRTGMCTSSYDSFVSGMKGFIHPMTLSFLILVKIYRSSYNNTSRPLQFVLLLKEQENYPV
jgi:hypothetical protein